MPLDLIIVQHAQKEPAPGDPGLTPLGREQARQAGAHLRPAGPIDELWSSSLRRALETAEHIAAELGIPISAIQRDDRIRERMNWPDELHQSREGIVREWERSALDRNFLPAFGDSSCMAGGRFAAFLDERHAARPAGRIVIVAHGGVTIDLLRTWLGDERVRHLAPGAIEHGVASYGITRIVIDGNVRTLLGIGLSAMDVEWRFDPEQTGTKTGQDR